MCYGHTGRYAIPGVRYTNEQCETILRIDISTHLAGLKAQCLRVPLNQNQQDAVLDFAFNLGVEATCKSTLMRKLNAGDYVGAANEFPKWDKATVNGRKVVLAGLVIRRTAERSLFLAPYYGEPSAIRSIPR